jgi:hypothetical protein
MTSIKPLYVSPTDHSFSYQLQSSTIDILRFPLAIMVICAHIATSTIAFSDATFPLFSEQGLFNLVQIIFTIVLFPVAVATFFFISGYLFFANAPVLTSNIYRYKIKRRLHSLIIPYFLWNSIAILEKVVLLTCAVWFANGSSADISELLSKGWHLFYDYTTGTVGVSLLGFKEFMSLPCDGPLWFLRDLIVVSLLSPLIYLFVKRLKIWGMAILLIAYIFKIWFNLPGFSIDAFFYFTLGAYLSVNHQNIVAIAHRYRYFVIPMTLILFAFECYYDGISTPIGYYIAPIYCILGVFALFYIASRLIMRYHIKPNKFLVSSCLFVYAIHTLGSTSFPRRIINIIIPGQSYIAESCRYILAIISAIVVCVALYAICRKYLPQITRILSGNK